jgi:soluble lytic murein transglycosylase-like protein
MTVLRLGRGRDEWRIICECQLHAQRERTLWRRSLRVMRGLRARGIALIVAVPLAFGTTQFPTEAMNTTLIATPRETLAALIQPRRTSEPSEFAIFTTPQVRENLLDAASRPQRFTLEVARDQFFRTQVPFGSIIYREALRNNLSPELVAAIVEAESDFRVRLVSHKNAQGLMQVIPSTGRLMGADDLFNPAENIAAGTKYLRYLFDRFGGDQRLVLAAYNAGEGNVEKFGGVPPFPETINYLRRVNARVHQYRLRVRGSYVASLRMHNALIAR